MDRDDKHIIITLIVSIAAVTMAWIVSGRWEVVQMGEMEYHQAESAGTSSGYRWEPNHLPPTYGTDD